MTKNFPGANILDNRMILIKSMKIDIRILKIDSEWFIKYGE